MSRSDAITEEAEAIKKKHFPNWDKPLDEKDLQYIQDTNAALHKMNPLDTPKGLFDATEFLSDRLVQKISSKL
jgi:hypothetical protein